MNDARTTMKSDATDRGFARTKFFDRYGQACSMQDSSLATERAIWLGVDFDIDGQPSTRMHLTQALARDITERLQRFIDTGSIEETGDDADHPKPIGYLHPDEIQRVREGRTAVVGPQSDQATVPVYVGLPIEPTRAEVKALQDIARQNKTDELETEYDAETASFEDGYDLCVDRARAALASRQEEAE